MKRPTLRQFNHGLSVVITLLCLYIVAAPLWPNVAYKMQKDPPLVEAEKSGKSQKIPDENTLVIPRMKFQKLIHESQDQSALNKGVWRDPHGSAPDQNANTILVGHRFTYGGPAVFYHLDKVQKGDKIILYWNKQKHVYQVENILVVPPTRSELVTRGDQKRLTIYTCTPLLTAKERLVIQAKPVEEQP